MKKTCLWIIMFGIMLLASACNPTAFDTIPSPTTLPIAPGVTLTPIPATLPPPTATSIPTATPLPTATLAQPGLTLEMLKNFTYENPDFPQKSVTLVDGIYSSGRTGDDFFEARLLDPVAFGDLNGDGSEEAAVLLVEDNAGSGTFVYLVVLLNQGGHPVQSGITYVEDRPHITKLTITDQSIRVEGLFHGPQDGLCCPSMEAAKTYQITPLGLAQVDFDTQTPDGDTRSIRITGPTQGSQVSGEVVLKGNVTIAPFENNLVYRIFDKNREKLAEGPFPVQSDTAGGPGVFEAPVDLAKIAPGQVVRLELLDLSPKDGSMLAMDSIDLVIR